MSLKWCKKNRGVIVLLKIVKKVPISIGRKMHIKGVRGTERVNLKNGCFEIVGLKNEIKFRKKILCHKF